MLVAQGLKMGFPVDPAPSLPQTVGRNCREVRELLHPAGPSSIRLPDFMNYYRDNYA